MAKVYSASVIGGGFGGNLSLKGLTASNRFELVAVADINPEVRKQLETDFPGIKSFASHHEMFTACPTEVVCVSTYAPTHPLYAMEAMNNDAKGLLIEKPLAPDLTATHELINAVETRTVPLVVPHGMFALPVPNQVMKLVQEGAIGSLTTIEIHSKVDLLNAGIHWLAFVRGLLADEPVKSVIAACDTSNHNMSDGVHVETQGIFCYQTESGIRIYVHTGESPCSNLIPDDQKNGGLFRFIGGNGLIEMHAWGSCYWIINDSYPSGQLIESRPADSTSSQQWLNDGLAHKWFLEQLADQMDNSMPDYSLPRISLGALEMIVAGFRSHTNRCRIELPLNENSITVNDKWPLGEIVKQPA